MRKFLALIWIAACCYAADGPKCTDIPGASALFSRSDLRFVLVGEMHGTNETPAIFADLICSARTLKRPLVVGIERPSGEQAAIDKFMVVENHEGAVRALESQKAWGVLDGRSSRAMLSLMEFLRAGKQGGWVAEVVAFDDARPNKPAADREERMAGALKAASDRHPNSITLALTGNLHAAKTSIKRYGDYPFMAKLLPQAETVSLFVSDLGGESWTQQNEGCGPHKLQSGGIANRGVDFTAKAPINGYDGVLATGKTATASLPAISDPPEPPACSKQ